MRPACQSDSSRSCRCSRLCQPEAAPQPLPQNRVSRPSPRRSRNGKMRTLPSFVFRALLTQHCFGCTAISSLQCSKNHGSGHLYWRVRPKSFPTVRRARVRCLPNKCCGHPFRFHLRQVVRHAKRYGLCRNNKTITQATGQYTKNAHISHRILLDRWPTHSRFRSLT